MCVRRRSLRNCLDILIEIKEGSYYRGSKTACFVMILISEPASGVSRTLHVRTYHIEIAPSPRRGLPDERFSKLRDG